MVRLLDLVRGYVQWLDGLIVGLAEWAEWFDGSIVEMAVRLPWLLGGIIL